MEIIKSKNGIYEIHQHYIITRFHQGCNVGLEEAALITLILTEHFQNDFGFIADRVNSYSFDPSVIPAFLEGLPFLKSFAWVNYNCHRNISMRFLATFFPETTELNSFSSLQQAKVWTTGIIKPANGINDETRYSIP